MRPGIDQNTGKSALRSGGPFLLFLAPAMHGANDPAGGYVAVGGPAGVFAAKGPAQKYLRVDSDSPRLPAEINLAADSLPMITKSEAQLLSEGP
ncbi:hypothetical protein ACWEOW_00510 [Monashia sp. NPDC004114]